MVGIAQLVEHLVVVQDVAGSSPVTHPKWVRCELATKGPPLVAVRACPLFLPRRPTRLRRRRTRRTPSCSNGLVSAWGDVNEQARKYASTPRSSQRAFDFDEDED